MDRSEFSELYNNMAKMVGATPIRQQEQDRLADQLTEKEISATYPDILRRLEHTLSLIREKYPDLEPDSNAGGRVWVENLLSDTDRIQKTLASLKKTLSRTIRGEVHSLNSLDSLERLLRSILNGGNVICVPDNLIIGGFMISEKCFGRCYRTCGLGAKSSDPQMSWELFDAASSSENLLMNKHGRIWLGSGEVLIYDQGGKKFFDVVDKLVRVRGHQVGFATAGLIPPNRKLGLEFFESLPQLGIYATDVRITLSFNLFFGFIKTPEDVQTYIDIVKETVDMIDRAGCPFGIIRMSDKENHEQTLEAYAEVEDQINSTIRFNNFESRESVLGVGFATGKDVDKDTDCSNKNRITEHALRTDGSLAINCPGFGQVGSRIGKLTENDVQQMRELMREHDRLFVEEVSSKPGLKCLRHQKWKHGTFRAPKSTRPMLKIRK